MQNRNSSTAAFVIGALAGGVAALLLAPQTGSQLRRRLRHDAENAGEQLGHLKETAREKIESVSGVIKGAGAEARGAYKDDMERRRETTGEAGVRRTGV